jgi:hypothetical protein
MPTTAIPSATPSGAPTLEVQSIDLAAVLLLEYMSAALTRGEGIDFEVTTEAHLREWLRNTPTFATEVQQLVVATDVDLQTLVDTSASRRKERRQRQVQETNNNEEDVYTLQIEFVIRVSFRSVRQDFDIRQLVSDAFASDVQRNRYIQRLQGSNTVFRLVSNVKFAIEGQSLPGNGSTSGETKDDDVMMYIIAAAGGGCALVLAGLAYLYCSRRTSSGDNHHVTTKKTKRRDDITTSASDKSPLGLAAEIQVVNRPTGDDISTLGDPMPVQVIGPTAPGDDNTASVGNDYDYTREYRRAHGLNASDQGSLERNGSVGSKTGNSASLFSSSDNTSIDMLAMSDPKRVQRIEVTVPPGKLGIVMDNSPSGTPMVYAVKPESVLAHDVRIGDRLLSVDQEDVTIMSAVQVSKLISLKSDQYRVLVFGRKVEVGTETAQDL